MRTRVHYAHANTKQPKIFNTRHVTNYMSHVHKKIKQWKQKICFWLLRYYFCFRWPLVLQQQQMHLIFHFMVGKTENSVLAVALAAVEQCMAAVSLLPKSQRSMQRWVLPSSCALKLRQAQLIGCPLHGVAPAILLMSLYWKFMVNILLLLEVKRRLI